MGKEELTGVWFEAKISTVRNRRVQDGFSYGTELRLDFYLRH
ncbi:unnamed protein product, partial [marine sediment metagenome]